MKAKAFAYSASCVLEVDVLIQLKEPATGEYMQWPLGLSLHSQQHNKTRRLQVAGSMSEPS